MKRRREEAGNVVERVLPSIPPTAVLLDGDEPVQHAAAYRCEWPAPGLVISRSDSLPVPWPASRRVRGDRLVALIPGGATPAHIEVYVHPDELDDQGRPRTEPATVLRWEARAPDDATAKVEARADGSAVPVDLPGSGTHRVTLFATWAPLEEGGTTPLAAWLFTVEVARG